MVVSTINPIEFTINGPIGVTTVAGQDFQCKVQPLFRGSINSVDLTSKRCLIWFI